MDFTSPFNHSFSFSKMKIPKSDMLPPLHLENLLKNVSPSQVLLPYCSFGWVAELCDAIRSEIPPLIELLKDVRWEVRVRAASALSKFAERREL
jgi:hypothetical protein